MQQAGDGLADVLQSIEFQAAKFPVVSNVTAGVITTPAEIPDILTRQLTSSVRWEGCIRKLIEMGTEQFLEIGPGRVLRGLCRKIDRAVPCVSVNSVEALDKMP